MSENDLWMCLWKLIAGIIMGTIFCAFLFNYLGQKDLINGGFVREMAIGSSTAQWIKK